MVAGEIAEVNMAGVECGPVKAEAKDTANSSKGLEVAVKHLQVYCNGLYTLLQPALRT